MSTIKTRLRDISNKISDQILTDNQMVGVEHLIRQIEQKVQQALERAEARNQKLAAKEHQKRVEQRARDKARAQAASQEKKAEAEHAIVRDHEPPTGATVELGSREQSMDIVTRPVEIGKPTLGVYATPEEAAAAMDQRTEIERRADEEAAESRKNL